MEVIISLVILSLVIWFVYWIIDSSGSKQFGHGVVVGKKFTPAHMQTTYVTTSQSDGRGGTITSTYPQITWIPDSYVLRIRIAGDMPSTSVSEEVYESFNEGDSIPVKYSQGRLSKDKIYIKKVGHHITQESIEGWECPNCKTINYTKTYECEKCRWGA